MKIETKPLSVNEAWQGRRFKTPAYKAYEEEMLWLLPPMTIPKNTPLHLSLTFGFSNKASDIDNPQKPFIDCLQKKYGFNDSYIYEIHTKKVIVPKGQEFIDFKIEPLL